MHFFLCFQLIYTYFWHHQYTVIFIDIWFLKSQHASSEVRQTDPNWAVQGTTILAVYWYGSGVESETLKEREEKSERIGDVRERPGRLSGGSQIPLWLWRVVDDNGAKERVNFREEEREREGRRGRIGHGRWYLLEGHGGFRRALPFRVVEIGAWHSCFHCNFVIGIFFCCFSLSASL